MTNPEALSTAAPSTAWAWRYIASRASHQRGNLNAEAALLGHAWLSDQALNTPNGYDYVSAAHVAALIGLARSTVERTLRGLAIAGVLELIGTHAGVRWSVTGDQARTLGRGSRVLGYRVPEVAFQ